MITINTNVLLPIFKYKVDNHKTIKPLILESIKEMGTYSFIDKDQNISNTDWHLNETFSRPYFKYIEPHINNICFDLKNKLGYANNSIQPLNYWYQQYKKNNHHSWHNHPKSLFSAVYYINLQNDNPKTSFKLGSKEFDISVEESEILIFPSFLDHTSKENKSEHTKTIISFNLT
jgi:hypothetical protein